MPSMRTDDGMRRGASVSDTAAANTSFSTALIAVLLMGRRACAAHACSILLDLAALHHDVARSFAVDLAAASYADVLALDAVGAVLFHRDAGAAGLDGDRVAGIDGQVLAHLETVILGDLHRAVLAHLGAQVLGH